MIENNIRITVIYDTKIPIPLHIPLFLIRICFLFIRKFSIELVGPYKRYAITIPTITGERMDRTVEKRSRVISSKEGEALMKAIARYVITAVMITYFEILAYFLSKLNFTLSSFLHKGARYKFALLYHNRLYKFNLNKEKQSKKIIKMWNNSIMCYIIN